jgi:predicted TIM-barrel fold metal-dependent hydrolase
LEHALDIVRLDGILLLTHVADRYLGHPDFDEFFAELDRRGALVILHPVRAPLRNMPQASYPDGYTELTFDTTRAIANMMWNGTLHRFPRIRYLMPHGGGTAPFLSFRFASMDDDPKVRERLPEGTAAHLRRFYYDIAQAAGAPALRALLEVADPERLMYGSDYPFAFNPEKTITDTMDALDDFKGFNEAEIRKVARENAFALFPRFAR